jgi:hypothetical protein
VKTVKLTTPIQFGEETIAELRFREEAVAGDMRGIPMRDPMYWDDLLKLAGRLCAQPDAVISKLSMADLQEVVPLVAGFLGGGPATGSAPSPS